MTIILVNANTRPRLVVFPSFIPVLNGLPSPRCSPEVCPVRQQTADRHLQQEPEKRYLRAVVRAGECPPLSSSEDLPNCLISGLVFQGDGTR
jgi:hypothetical protein